MISSILAIVVALIWALSATLARREIDKSDFFSASIVTAIVGVTILIPLALLLTPLSSINIYGVLLFLLAGFFIGFVRLLYFKGMEEVGASVNASIYASNPIFSALIAAILLGEELTYGAWIGIVCVICGASVIQRAMYIDDLKSESKMGGIIYPLLAAILAGFSYVIKKQGLNLCDAPIMGAATGEVATLCLYLLIGPTLPSIKHSVLDKQSFKLFWRPGLGICIGNLLLFYAFRYGDVSTVVPLIRIEPLFIFLLTHYYLKGVEAISLKLVIGAITIILGAILVVIA